MAFMTSGIYIIVFMMQTIHIYHYNCLGYKLQEFRWRRIPPKSSNVLPFSVSPLYFPTSNRAFPYFHITHSCKFTARLPLRFKILTSKA